MERGEKDRKKAAISNFSVVPVRGNLYIAGNDTLGGIRTQWKLQS